MTATNTNEAAGSRQSRVEQIEIPVNLPLQRETFKSPLWERGEGGILRGGGFRAQRVSAVSRRDVMALSDSPRGLCVNGGNVCLYIRKPLRVSLQARQRPPVTVDEAERDTI